jgi:hypothetical protein
MLRTIANDAVLTDKFGNDIAILDMMREPESSESSGSGGEG